jgi:anthranilate phosphoribosyltransferase
LGNSTFERLLLKPQDYGFSPQDVPLVSGEEMLKLWQELLSGQTNALTDTAILNGGFYLWRCGVSGDLSTGFARAEELLNKCKVWEKLQEISLFSL